MRTRLIYTGIGSRSTPADVLASMEELARVLSTRGFYLRSGGAPGADQAFEKGHTGPKAIYLPWGGFAGRTSVTDYSCPDPRAFQIAAELHPFWRYLRRGARALHARNVHQFLGWTLDKPSTLVVCWTPDGASCAAECSGGTGGSSTVIRLATQYQVPVFNLRRVSCASVLTFADTCA